MASHHVTPWGQGHSFPVAFAMAYGEMANVPLLNRAHGRRDSGCLFQYTGHLVSSTQMLKQVEQCSWVESKFACGIRRLTELGDRQLIILHEDTSKKSEDF